MKTTVLAILVVACAVGIRNGDAKRGIKVKFNLSVFFEINVFYRVAMTVAEAKKDGWIETDTPDSPEVMKEFNMYCYKDKTICVLFEPHTGQIAGLQIALCKDRFTPCHFDMEQQGWSLWSTEINGVETECYVIQQFYINSDFLQLSAANRISTYNTSKLVQGNYFSIVGMDKQMMDVPMDINEVKESTLFMEKAYIPWMGNHYYYNMTESTGCSSEEIKPWFLLETKEQVIGCCMMTLGKLNLPFLARNWFEEPTDFVVKTIVTNGPQCLYDLAKECGVVTCHIYWIDDPQSL